MSPVSRVRRPHPARQPQADKSAVAQAAARHRYRRTRILIRVGQVLMGAALVLAVEHAAAHLGAFGGQQPSVLIDLGAGWPLAAVLFIVGAILAGQKQ